MSAHSKQRAAPGDAVIRRLLTSAPAMRFKAAVRDVVWTVRGRTMLNPPLRAGTTSVVFVCLGNICRSPFAERLMSRLLVERRDVRVRVTSAGFRASPSTSSPSTARQAARRYDVSLDDHQPLLLTDDLVNSHDVIIVMEPAHRAEISRRWPAHDSKVQLLSLFIPPGERVGAFERVHLVDPFGKSLVEFERCYARIAAAVPPLLRALTGDPQ